MGWQNSYQHEQYWHAELFCKGLSSAWIWAVQVPGDVGNVNDNKYGRHTSLVNVMLCEIQTQRDWIPVMEGLHTHTHPWHTGSIYTCHFKCLKSRCDSIHLVLSHKSDCILLAFPALDENPVHMVVEMQLKLFGGCQKAPEQQCGNNSLPIVACKQLYQELRHAHLHWWAMRGPEVWLAIMVTHPHRSFNSCTDWGSDKCFKSLCFCRWTENRDEKHPNYHSNNSYTTFI